MAKEKPVWVKRQITRAWKSAHIHNKLGKTREQYALQHRQVIRDLHGATLPDAGTVDLLRACDRMILASLAAPISGEEWDAIVHWHRETAQALTSATYVTEMLCEECLAKVEESGVSDLAEDADLVEAVSAVFTMIERVAKQSKDARQQRRRFLRILETMGENGTSTTVNVSADGFITAEQGGMTVGHSRTATA